MISDELRNKINAVLDSRVDHYKYQTVDWIMVDVRLLLPEAYLVSDTDLRSVVVGYILFHDDLFRTILMAPALSDQKIKQVVEGAIKTVTQGVKVERDPVTVKVTVSGVTAELAKGDVKASAGVSWGGTLSLGASKGNINFNGELAQDHWKIVISYPTDTAVPDLNTLGTVASQGEQGLIGIIGATQGIKSADDIKNFPDKIKPFVKPVSDAMDAVQGIAKAPKTGLSVGVTFGSPDSPPGATGIRPGVQGVATLTFTF